LQQDDQTKNVTANEDRVDEKSDSLINIHRISVAGFANAYLLEGKDGLILVDAGPPLFEQQILDKMEELGRDDLRLIFITHAHIDHYGGAAVISAATGALIAIHEADAEALAKGETRLGSVRYLPRQVTDYVLPRLEPNIRINPTEADVLFKDGADLSEYGLDARVIHLPGHTPGSAGLVVDQQIAFIGDLISTAGGPHIQRSYADDWMQLRRNVEQLKERKPSIIYAGHGSEPLTAEELDALSK